MNVRIVLLVAVVCCVACSWQWVVAVDFDE